jgi:ribosomal protein S21
VSEIKREKSESFESFLRRARRVIQYSGVLIQARKIQYHDRKKSKNVRRKQRVQRIHEVSRENYLRKIGRLPQEEDERTNFKKAA